MTASLSKIDFYLYTFTNYMKDSVPERQKVGKTEIRIKGRQKDKNQNKREKQEVRKT